MCSSDLAAGAPNSAEISAETLAAAERLAGIELPGEKRPALVREVTARASAYREVRAKPLPNSLAPALTFNLRAAAPPRVPSKASTPETWNPPEAIRPTSAEDLAFLPVARLSALLRSGRVTSRELTELFLERLQRLDPVLQAVVTLVPDRARKQADEIGRAHV